MLRAVAGIIFFASTLPMAAATFYVDALSGNDANSGLSAAQSWKTLAPVNRLALQPGDSLLFHGGQLWRGTLSPNGRGAAGNVIRISRYGDGAMPRIEGDGTQENAVLLRNMDQLEVSDLDICNKGDGSAMRRGVLVLLENFGVAHHIVLRHLFVHDVGGTLDRKDSGGIVLRAFGQKTPSRFDDLLIERNVVLHVDRSGIMQQTNSYSRARWLPSTAVVLRDNYVEDVGGDGIVPLGTSHALIEGNVVVHAVSRSREYNAGVWPWSSDDALFQWNDVSATGGTKDGEGYDSDYNSHRTRFEHNYSHDNTGGFMLICTPGIAAPGEDVDNIGTRVVSNISYADRARIFAISGGSDTVIEKNLIVIPSSVIPKDAPMQVVVFTMWKAWASDVLIDQNRIFAEGKALSGHAIKGHDDGTFDIAPGWGDATNIRLDSNIYLKHSPIEPAEPTAKFVKSSDLNGIDWQGPTFDAARNGGQPAAVDRFFQQHAQWMHTMFIQAHMM